MPLCVSFLAILAEACKQQVAKHMNFELITLCVSHEVTILKEFCQGPNQMMYSLPAGSFDEKRHKDYAGCAQAELWEEVSHTCNLRG